MKHGIWLPIGLSICVLAAAHADPPPAQPDPKDQPPPKEIPEFEQAGKSFRAGDYEGCLKLLQQAKKNHEELSPARLILAKMFFLHNQAGMGRAALEQSVVENPDHPENYLIFGKMALTEGRITDAWLHFQRAELLANDYKGNANQKRGFQVEALADQSAVAERRKDWKAAETVLTSLLVLDPKHSRARENLAVVLFHEGQHDKASETLKQACKDNPNLEPAGLTLGRLWTEAGDLTKAQKLMEEAVVHEPRRAHLGYANWLLEQNRPEEAKIHAEAAAEVNPASTDVRYLRGLIARYMKDFATAEKIFEALHTELPGTVAAGNNMAVALVEQTADKAKLSRGLEMAEINARLYPNTVEVLTTLGRAYYRNGRLEEAEQALRNALASGGASSDAMFYLAQVLSDRGRLDEVAKLLKAALDAPGCFLYRKDALLWSEQLAKKPGK